MFILLDSEGRGKCIGLTKIYTFIQSVANFSIRNLVTTIKRQKSFLIEFWI